MTYYQIIEPFLQKLDKLRQDESLIKDFLCVADKNEEGYFVDINARNRYGILKALQYQHLSSDEQIIIDLFKAETERHREEAFQGLFPALEVGGYLLSQYQKPEYVELFLKAKDANFDTFCGFDRTYLVSAGVERTLNYVKSLDRVYQERFDELVGNDIKKIGLTEEKLEEWRQNEQRLYREEVENPTIYSLIMLAEDLENFGIIEQLKKNQ